MRAFREQDGRRYFIKPWEPGWPRNWGMRDQSGKDAGPLTVLRVYNQPLPPDALTNGPFILNSRYERAEYLLDWVTTGMDENIVSDRVRALLLDFDPELEFAPVEIEINPHSSQGEAGRLVGGFWWLYCRRRVDLIDEDASDLFFDELGPPYPYQTWRKQFPIQGWKRLVTKTEDTPYPVFQLNRVSSGQVFLAEECRQRLLSDGCRAHFGIENFDRILGGPAKVLMQINPHDTPTTPQTDGMRTLFSRDLCNW